MAEEKINDLLSIIEKEDAEIDYYLSDVSKEQFKKDVRALMNKISDNGPIREAIKYLSGFIK